MRPSAKAISSWYRRWWSELGADMAIIVAIESPLQDEVRQLIGELNQALLALTPAEFCYHMTAEEMASPDTTVFVAREDGAAVACGALRRHDGGIGIGRSALDCGASADGSAERRIFVRRLRGFAPDDVSPFQGRQTGPR